MRLSKKTKRSIVKEALRIKAIYETPNTEVDKIIAELKEAVNIVLLKALMIFLQN